jgi:hypothetical protein
MIDSIYDADTILSAIKLDETQRILCQFVARLVIRAADGNPEATNALRFWSDQARHDVDRMLRERRLHGS